MLNCFLVGNKCLIERNPLIKQNIKYDKFTPVRIGSKYVDVYTLLTFENCFHTF